MPIFLSSVSFQLCIFTSSLILYTGIYIIPTDWCVHFLLLPGVCKHCVQSVACHHKPILLDVPILCDCFRQTDNNIIIIMYTGY